MIIGRNARQDLVAGFVHLNGVGRSLVMSMDRRIAVSSSRAAVHAPAQWFLGERDEPSLDQVHPRATGRRTTRWM